MPSSVLVSQPITFPTSPDSTRLPEFDPSHTVVEPLKVPPTAGGSTVMMTALEVSFPHEPLETIARYSVLVVRLL